MTGTDSAGRTGRARRPAPLAVLAALVALAMAGLLAGCGPTGATGLAATSASHAEGAASPSTPAPDLAAAGPASTAAPSTSSPAPATSSVAAPRASTSSPTTSPATSPPAPTHSANLAAADPFPVPVTVGNAAQVITVKASGTWATVIAWQHSSTGWHAVLRTSAGRVGANGVVPGSTRKQGTDTTPAGTYTLTQAFGIKPNPGSAMPYHLVTADDWWVEDNYSKYYNTMRQASLGGFDTSLPESDVNGSEHLINHPGQYNYVVVINFNMNPAVPYRGAGIFLHVADGYPTAGCVSVPQTTLVGILKWLRPDQHPRIAIG